MRLSPFLNVHGQISLKGPCKSKLLGKDSPYVLKIGSGSFCMQTIETIECKHLTNLTMEYKVTKAYQCPFLKPSAKVQRQEIQRFLHRIHHTFLHMKRKKSLIDFAAEQRYNLEAVQR